MNKFIDKQEAIDAIGERPISWTDSEYELGKQNQYDEDMLALIDVPTVEAELVRHGKWIERKNYPGLACYCSECNYKLYGRPYQNTYLIVPYNFCPNCGAKMDEVER